MPSPSILRSRLSSKPIRQKQMRRKLLKALRMGSQIGESK